MRKDERVEFLAGLQVMGSQGEVKSFTEVAEGVWHFYEAVPILRKRKPVFFTGTPGAAGLTGDLPAYRQEFWIHKIPTIH